MSALQVNTIGKAKAQDPPRLTNEQWLATGLLGLVLLVMAILQIIGFTDFRDWLAEVGFAGPSVWAAIIILAEIWGAVTMFKIRLSNLFRWVGGVLAVAVAGFWFYENLRVVGNGINEIVDSSGLFGKYLTQRASWWTILEVTVLLFWTIYAVTLLSARRR